MFSTIFADSLEPDVRPCEDEADTYSCFYDIVMLDACEKQIAKMEKLCRFSCNFCKS